jgi:hypothetical protein
VRPVNTGRTNRAVGSAQDELLPEVRLASDVGQRLRGTSNPIEQGNLLGVIEDEVGWLGFPAHCRRLRKDSRLSADDTKNRQSSLTTANCESAGAKEGAGPAIGRGGLAEESRSRFVHIGCIAARYSGHAACGGTRGSSCGRGWVSSGEHPFTITNGHAPGENGRF